MRIATPLFFSFAVLAFVACKPEFAERNSSVTGVRILGVRSEPAEAKPNDDLDITYDALVADENGTRADLDIKWAYCTLPTPVSELNDVSPECFQVQAPYIKPFANQGEKTTAKLPSAPGENACNQFGPDIPSSIDGGPPGRPADPDSTGGFYQPIRLLYVNRQNTFDFVLAETRIKCNLPGATTDVAADYQLRYRLNQNPEIDAISAVTSGGPPIILTTEDMGESGLVVPPGASVQLTASYAACPAVPECGNGICEAKEDEKNCPADCMTPKGCTGAEHYVYFDLMQRGLVERREGMRLSWFSNQGTFTDDRTGRTEEEADLTSIGNTWTAPSTPGLVTLWAVLRDSRGGLTWKSYKIRVQ